ncbi:N-glycosylation protein-domain-containing protein [Fusarium solani]|uniref:N-glycosylation protein-domain-containing protein n=1 Tax=Fusarium solani TaxID=169388 RepID=A0A9P9H0X8_FUSSL|nr:N-glycosylation protein-domain-containing protein [Fusarium solani]KAH7248214.1 N-glycosylation protein-domain-containing protein [Fusarium solani]
MAWPREMVNPSSLHQGSSRGHLPLPLQPPAPATSNSTTTPTTVPSSSSNADAPLHPYLLQPRVAVVLNVPMPWHPWLFALRLVSVLPALWWGLPSAVQLLLRLLPGPELVVVVPSAAGGIQGLSVEADSRYALTEMGLATIWKRRVMLIWWMVQCFVSGYLSFFFTDCLVSRWLINYTPQATMVRLLTINACNAYFTAVVLSLTGGFQDPRLLLPGWICIATTLTVMYHIIHQKMNIRKQTPTSIDVSSMASFLSMVTLLAHMHLHSLDYPQIPLISSGRHAWDEVLRVVAQVRGSIEQHDEL